MHAIYRSAVNANIAPPPFLQPHTNRSLPLPARHAAKTDTSGGVFACWPWTGSLMQQNGYGQVRAISSRTGKTTMRTAHSIAWEVANNCPVPAGKIVRHVCHNPVCQNPAHLRLGCHSDNRADDKAAGKKARRLSADEVRMVAKLSGTAPATAVAAQFKVGTTTVRSIWRGKTYSAVTGIAAHTKKGGRPRLAASPAPAPAPAPVIILDVHRKNRQAPEPSGNTMH